MALSDFPKSYKDPLYASLDSSNEQKYGLPVGLLAAIRTHGERTDADKVSSAGARTPYQITPATRKAAIDKYGIDPYLSADNASEVAARLLQDSYKRNGDVEQTVREYQGGTDPSNWGKQNDAYWQRVSAGQESAKLGKLGTDFSKFLADNPANVPVSPSPTGAPAAAQPPAASPTDKLSQGFGEFLAQNGGPAGYAQPPAADPTLLQKVEALPGAIKESITGAKRTTPEVQKAIDEGRTFDNIPENHKLSWGAVKSSLGDMFANPKEKAQIWANNLPGVTVREDAQGNQWLRSPTDGKEYVIQPGFDWQHDIPTALGLIAAYTPAGRAATIPAMAVKSALTQAAIEGSQAATGGNFDTGEVATAGITGAAIPAAARVLQAAKGPVVDALQSLKGVPNPAQAVRAGAAEAAGTVPAAVQEVPPAASAEVPPAAPIAPAAPQPAAGTAAAAPAETMPAADLAQTAKKAAEGGFGSNRATKVLAEQAAPDAKTVEAAKRLGIEEYLQPDHVTTNQAYRELSQAAKSIPGSAARAAELQGLEKVAQRADKLIDDLGGTEDLSSLSADVKGKLQSVHDQLKAKASDLYDQVRSAIPQTSEAPAPTVLSMINARAEELGGVKNLSSMERMILGKLSPKVMKAAPQSATDILAGAPRTTQTVKQPTYALLDDVRRDLTAAKYSKQGPFKDSDDRLITMLEGALRRDQEAAVARYGMSDTWNLAQKTSATYKGIQDDLSALFGKDLDKSIVPSLHGAVRALPAGDSSKLVSLLKSVPEDMRQQVVASGLNSAFGKTAKNGTISFNGFARWYEGLLRNKRAYTAVMSNLPPQARKQLSDLYRVSNGIGAASKERIQTGKLKVYTDTLEAETLIQKMYSVAQRSTAAGVAGTMVGHVPIVGPGLQMAVASALTKAKTPAINAVDKIISSPEFLNLAKQAGKPGEKAARLRLVHSKEFTRFVRAIGQPRELSDRERWVLQAMQANNQQR